MVLLSITISHQITTIMSHQQNAAGCSETMQNIRSWVVRMPSTEKKRSQRILVMLLVD